MPVKHPFPPLYNSESKILILGSFPSVKSREANFFYAHPQNRFWKVMAYVLNLPVPQTIDEKKDMLYKGKIALWDSLASCDITGSSDASIKNPVANDLSEILNSAKIKLICFNGKKSEEIYNKYGKNCYGGKTVCLPSTSPANAQLSIDALSEIWSRVLRPEL